LNTSALANKITLEDTIKVCGGIITSYLLHKHTKKYVIECSIEHECNLIANNFYKMCEKYGIPKSILFKMIRSNPLYENSLVSDAYRENNRDYFVIYKIGKLNSKTIIKIKATTFKNMIKHGDIYFK